MPLKIRNSHHKAGGNNCHLLDNPLTCNKNENPQDFVKMTILEACPDATSVGLNKREEVVVV